MMDVILTLAALRPSPDFIGSVVENTREEYERIAWRDARPQPTWDDLLAKWPEVEASLADQAAADAFDPVLVVERLAAAALTGDPLDLPADQRDAINARRSKRGELAV